MRFSFLVASILALAAAGCSREGFSHSAGKDVLSADTLTTEASLLVLEEPAALPGVTLVTVRNPWKTEGKPLAKLALMARGSEVDTTLLPGDLTGFLTVPLERTAVFAGVHAAAYTELDALGSLCAVADADYLPEADTVAALVRRGAIINVGAAASPSLEKLISSRAQAVLLSPMQDQALPAVPPGAVIIPMADYLETTPLARAEWLRLIGRLTGREAVADSIYHAVRQEYTDIASRAAATTSPRPKVLTETEFSGVWYVPAGGSYMSRLISDAGGESPWAEIPGTGSVAMDMERVLASAADADVWLIRTYGYEPTLKTLRAANSRNSAFRAFRTGQVWVCNSALRPIFNDLAFHPERILNDMAAIFHPELSMDGELRYYRRAEK